MLHFLLFQPIFGYLYKPVPIAHCTDLQQVTDTSAIGMGGNILHSIGLLWQNLILSS